MVEHEKTKDLGFEEKFYDNFQDDSDLSTEIEELLTKELVVELEELELGKGGGGHHGGHHSQHKKHHHHDNEHDHHHHHVHIHHHDHHGGDDDNDYEDYFLQADHHKKNKRDKNTRGVTNLEYNFFEN